jgi:hypothetical protein
MTATAKKERPVPAYVPARLQAINEANARANADKVTRKAKVETFIETEGIKLRHFRLVVATPLGDLATLTGGISVAYRQRAGNSFIELSTAICRQNENFSRKLGTLFAVEQFIAGQHIRVPTFGLTAEDVMDGMFLSLTTADADTASLFS